MKTSLLLSLCMVATVSAVAQPSNYSPLRQSYFYSPWVMAGESNPLFQTFGDPYLAVQLNPADAERLRMGRTLANMSWQTGQTEEYLRSRTCEIWQNCGFFALPPDTLSRTAMAPNFSMGVVHHADQKRFSPVFGFTAQYYTHEIPLASPQFYISRYAGTPSSTLFDGVSVRNGVDQRRSGYLLGGSASVKLSSRWETGLRYQFNAYSSRGGNDFFTTAHPSSFPPGDVLGRHEHVRSNARQHEISAGMAYRTGRSSLSASYTGGFGSETARQSGSFYSTVSADEEFRSRLDLGRHQLYAHLSHRIKPALSLHWVNRFIQMKNPTASHHRSGYMLGAGSYFSSSITFSDVYEENGEEITTDTQRSLESGLGMVASLRNVTLSAGLFVGQASAELLVDNRRTSYARNSTINEETGRREFTEYEQRLQRDLDENRTMDFASLPVQVAYRISKHFQASAGTELLLRRERSRIHAELPNGPVSENLSDRRFDHSLYFGARFSPNESWELNFRWLPMQRPDFGKTTDFATDRVMVSVTRAW